ncbi:MAG TPA: hypothetical protein VIM73_02605 [Polyangiaceae bacterium]
MSATRLALVLAVTLAAAGCKKDKAPSAAPSASAKAGAMLGNAEPGLLGELVALANTCKVTVESGTVNCPKGEHRKLINRFASNQQDRVKAVGTFASGLTHEDPKVRVVSANVLYGAFRGAWGEAKAGSVTPADADALIAATFQLPKPQARQAIPAAVHAAELSGRSAALEAALAKAPEAEYKTLATRYLMTHGRMSAFPKVQELAKSQNPAEVLAALESPRNMPAWTPEEQNAICPWASEFLGDNRPSVASRAASLLGNCGGEFVDKLLEKGEAALKEGKFANADVAGYRELCGPRRRSSGGGASEEQCSRARKLLEKVVEAKALEVQTRNTALTTLAYQWPDDETLKLAKKLEKNPDKTISEQARRTVLRLEQRRAMASPSASGRAPGGPLGRPLPIGAEPRARAIAQPAIKPVSPPPAAPEGQ